MNVEVRVTGVPKAQPRARAFSRGGKARMYTKGTAENWKSRVVDALEPHRPEAPISEPVRVDIDFLLSRPKRLMRRKDPEGELRHTSKPDRDNLDKAVLDALTEAGWWLDDALVCDGRVRKFYHSKTEAPGARITITTLDGESN